MDLVGMPKYQSKLVVPLTDKLEGRENSRGSIYTYLR